MGTRTTTTFPESAPGDTVMPLALFKRLVLDQDLAQPLDLALAQPPDLALGPPAQPTTGRPQDPLAPSRSTSWAPPTLVAPPLTGTPGPGARLRLTRWTTTLLESAPGDTATPPALFKRRLPPPRPLLSPQLLQDQS